MKTILILMLSTTLALCFLFIVFGVRKPSDQCYGMSLKECAFTERKK